MGSRRSVAGVSRGAGAVAVIGLNHPLIRCRGFPSDCSSPCNREWIDRMFRVGVRSAMPVRRVGVRSAMPVRRVGVRSAGTVRRVGVRSAGTVRRVGVRSAMPVRCVGAQHRAEARCAVPSATPVLRRRALRDAGAASACVPRRYATWGATGSSAGRIDPPVRRRCAGQIVDAARASRTERHTALPRGAVPRRVERAWRNARRRVARSPRNARRRTARNPGNGAATARRPCHAPSKGLRLRAARSARGAAP